MYAWEQIQLVLDYLEDHLEEPVEIIKLAEMARLSPFYFQRLFSRLVKKPVAEYVKLRRMARAADALRGNDRRILDIALELGFSSHEHFTRTFKETFGMTPEEFRKAPQSLNRMTKPELLLHYTVADEGAPLITEGIVLELNRRTLKEPVRFAGLEQEMPVSFLDGLGTESGVDPLCALWDDLHGKKTAVLGIPGDSEEIGVTLPSSKEGCFRYFAGAKTPDGFQGGKGSCWQLPEGEYLICVLEAEGFETLVQDALYKAQQYVYGVWLPKHDLQTEAFCAERYERNGPGTTRMELWMKLLP